MPKRPHNLAYLFTIYNYESLCAPGGNCWSCLAAHPEASAHEQVWSVRLGGRLTKLLLLKFILKTWSSFSNNRVNTWNLEPLQLEHQIYFTPTTISHFQKCSCSRDAIPNMFKSLLTILPCSLQPGHVAELEMAPSRCPQRGGGNLERHSGDGFRKATYLHAKSVVFTHRHQEESRKGPNPSSSKSCLGTGSRCGLLGWNNPRENAVLSWSLQSSGFSCRDDQDGDDPLHWRATWKKP